MSQQADHVVLSSGQVLFADPTLPWTPNNFPNLPSSQLSFTAIGQIDGRDISTLAFRNVITYEPYETPSIRPTLSKNLIVNSAGIVSYADPKIGIVSTVLQAFDVGITSFAPSGLGAAGISQTPPDTLTNAIAKLDAWIANALLYQPPAITYVEHESNAFYGGVRWHNFKSYRLLDKSVPFVSGIVLLLGTPSSGNYLTLELTNSDWFPDRLFVDGLLSDFNPIVRLRVFSKFFLDSADEIYSKQVMQKKCVRLVGEGGIYTLPNVGKVFAVQNSINGETYTTVNLYLPQIPVGTDIPVRVIYVNKTSATVNIADTVIREAPYGGPGPVSTIVQNISTPSSIGFLVNDPIYSDAVAQLSTPFFSSYIFQYIPLYMNAAGSSGGVPIGYRYGQATQTLPSYFATYSNAVLKRSYTYIASTQQVNLIGLDNYPLYPGVAWAISTSATNMANFEGSSIYGPYPSLTSFPNTTTKNISTVRIASASPFGIDAANSSLWHLNYAAGWSLTNPVNTNVIFMSSQSQLFNFRTNEQIRLNDISFPGNRSDVIVRSYYSDISNALTSNSLTISSFNNDFPIGTPLLRSIGNSQLTTTLFESQSNSPTPYQKFYYNQRPSGTFMISTITSIPQSIYFTQNLQMIVNGLPQISLFQSTPRYTFITEPDYPYSTANILYKNRVTSTIYVAGMLTPTSNSLLTFDMQAVNFVNRFAGSNLGYAALYYDDSPDFIDPSNATIQAIKIGKTYTYTSSVRVFNGSSEITTLPFPQGVLLTVSSCVVQTDSNYYQDPADPRAIYIGGEVTPVNVGTTRSTYMKSLTSSFFIDTVSASSFSTFSGTYLPNGLRVASLMPRVEAPGAPNNINDSVDSFGNAGPGLDVATSSFFAMTGSNTLNISSFIEYNHVSSVSSVWTNYYSRELLYTNGGFQHPAGLDFSVYKGALLGNPSATYPNFIRDLANDVNYGYRYSQFVYEFPTFPVPTPFQYITIHVNNPSLVSTIEASRDYNFNFPNAPIPATDLQYSKVRMHLKIYGAFVESHYSTIETAWINCFKPFDYNTYDDGTFDVGGCVSVRTSSTDVFYKVQINRRDYTKICPIVRVGISHDGSAEGIPSESGYLPITFKAINVECSD